VTVDEKHVPDWRSLSLDERRERLLEALPNLLPSLTGEDWLAGAVLEILAGAMENLHTYVEDVAEPGISWAEPFVELHYPVEWDWEVMGPAAVPLRDEDLETPEKSAWRLAEGTTTVLHLEAMKYLTKGAAVHVKDGVALPLIAPEVQAAVDAMTEEERDAFFEDFGKPFEAGGFFADEPAEEEDGKPISPELAARLEAAGEPFLEFQGDVNGEPFAGSTYFGVDPLVVNEDEKLAFYPVTVGLLVHPKADGTEHDFSALPHEDREAFWKTFTADLWEAARKLREKKAAEGAELSASGGAVEVSGAEATATVTPAPLARIQRTRVMPDGPSLVSRETATLVRHAGGLALPRKWSSVPVWDDLAAEERDSLLETYGERAFRTLDDRPPLLKWVTDRETEKRTAVLTREAEDLLADRVGVKGYRRLLRDEDKVSREYLVRRFASGSGHVEVRVSWYNAAAPFHADAMTQRRKDLEALLQKLEEPALFEDLNAKDREKVEYALRNLVHIQDGKRVMEAAARKLRNGTNPVTMPVYELKTLLECHGADDAMDRIRGCLRALQEVRYSIRVTGGSGPAYHAFGPFLAGVREEKKGAGKHTDSLFHLEVSREFLGCLEVFRVRDDVLRKGRNAVLYDFQKKLSAEEKKALSQGFVQGFSTLAPHYDVTKGFTNEQTNLRAWIEAQVTRRKDATAKGRKKLQVKDSAPDADEPRLYGSDFCPLIPEGRSLACALGHYVKGRAPEAGRTLGGATSRSTATGGPHVGGLLEVMGYYYPPGMAHERRRAIVRDALQDIVRVVESFEGVVAARRDDGRWLTVEEAAALPELELVKKVKWFLFVTPDMGGHMARAVEDHYNALADKGVMTHRVRVERAAPQGAPAPAHRVGLEGEELRVRLHAERRKRNLSQAQVAVLFGVSKMALSNWETEKKPIPAELEALVLRWVETGQAPTAEELASRRNRRTGVNPRTGSLGRTTRTGLPWSPEVSRSKPWIGLPEASVNLASGFWRPL